MTEPGTILTPEEILKSMYASYLAEHKALVDAKARAKVAKERIRKARKLIQQLSGTWGLENPLTRELPAMIVPTNPRPEGVTVETPDGRWRCDECDREFDTESGLHHHQTVKHG